MIPIATGNPPSLRESRGKIAKSFRELLRRVRIPQIDAVQLKAAGHEMNVSIVESRQNQLASRVNYARGFAGKSLDFIIGADGDDSISVDRQCLRRGLGGVHSVNAGVKND